MDGFIKLAAAAVIAAFAAAMLKKQAPEFSILLGLGGGICVLVIILKQVPRIYDTFSALVQYIPDADGIMLPLFKACGICITSKLAAETCRDCEQKSLAAKVELAGSAACFIAAIPIFARVFDIMGEML